MFSIDYAVRVALLFGTLFVGTAGIVCPRVRKYGKSPTKNCVGVVDPNLKPRSNLEKWFTKEMWEDFFPHANQGWGNEKCLPYSYESFLTAIRYFPEFGAETTSKTLANSSYSIKDLQRRDVAAFFAHTLQESGENNLRMFNNSDYSPHLAKECFYRGGFYQYFEGGPKSHLFPKKRVGSAIDDGGRCVEDGRYCLHSAELDFWYPCKMYHGDNSGESENSTYTGCYFGRGPLQLSWNYNYGQFQHFLRTEGVEVDLLDQPNLVLQKLDPPLAMLSALWFYMTPQPPKPSMHDIMMGNWLSSEKNAQAGYNGSVFGPTSLVINNECTGVDVNSQFPGGPGENRRIQAFKWFCKKLGVDPGSEKQLSCKDMPEGFDSIRHNLSWQPDWSNMWRAKPCDCAPASYAGVLPYYDPKIYGHSKRLSKENERNRLRCVYAIYKNPEVYRIDENNSPCLKHAVKIKLTRFGPE